MALLNIRVPVISSEYVRVQVTATKNGVLYNPTSDSVYFQFTSVGVEPVAPAPASPWATGTWDTAGNTYVALGLVGPLGTTLATGTYSIWVQVTDNPEQPARMAGTLQVY